MNFLGFGQSAEVDIIFDDADTRKLAEIKTEDGKKEKYLLYYDGETVSGKVNVTLKKPGSKLEHQGIKVELIGQIELFYDRGNHHEFTSLVKELARPGDLIQNTSYPFEFSKVEKPFEVYVGSNVRLRYFLRVTVVRRISDIIREVDIAVHTLCTFPDLNSPIKMEVGIEDCLHIEFEYNKSKYHLKDVIVGKIYFLLVRIKIKHMEIAIIKRETTGSGPNTYTENETIAKYEIMDGAPVKGESIPIRVFLAGYDLTPTMRDINKKFSVRYFLNLVLMDTEDRRYFKQQEITLWRKADKSRKSQSQSANNPHVPTHLVGGPDNDMPNKYPLNSVGIIGSCNPNIGIIGGGGDCSGGSSSSDVGAAVENSDPITSGMNTDRRHNVPDARMGLFTRESPQQESKQLSVSISNDIQQNSSPKNIGDDEINSESIHDQTISGEIERGTADGSSVVLNEKLNETSGLLFHSSSIKTPISTTETESATKSQNNNARDAIIDTESSSTTLNNTECAIDILQSQMESSDKRTYSLPQPSEENEIVNEENPQETKSNELIKGNETITETASSVAVQLKHDRDSSNTLNTNNSTAIAPLMTPYSPTTD